MQAIPHDLYESAAIDGAGTLAAVPGTSRCPACARRSCSRSSSRPSARRSCSASRCCSTTAQRQRRRRATSTRPLGLLHVPAGLVQRPARLRLGDRVGDCSSSSCSSSASTSCSPAGRERSGDDLDPGHRDAARARHAAPARGAASAAAGLDALRRDVPARRPVVAVLGVPALLDRSSSRRTTRPRSRSTRPPLAARRQPVDATSRRRSSQAELRHGAWSTRCSSPASITVGTVLLCTLAGFAFAKLRFRGRERPAGHRRRHDDDPDAARASSRSTS